jgi:lipopolysaccharide transport system permease protein
MSLTESELQPTNLQSIGDIAVIRIEPSRGWASVKLSELWAYRELLYFLVWRDVKVRYKQTVIGIGWTILQPLTTMVIFTLIFSHFAKIPSDGLPYPVFAYTALLPWNLFSGALNRCTFSLVGSANLITKVYFPRLIVPVAAVISGLVDFTIAFILLLGIMLWYHMVPTVGVFALPILLLVTLSTALAVGLWLSALNVRYRDVGHAIPFLIQIWMFLSPVAYPVSLVPEKWRLLYSLNPMVGVIEGFRWALLAKGSPDFLVIAVSTVIMIALLVSGLVYFKRMERTFADVV